MKRPNLNRVLTLETVIRTPDGAGGFDETWSQVGTLWAQVRAQTGREGEVDHARLSQTIYEITVQAAPFGAPSRPSADQRFVEGSRIFRILSVNEKDTQGRYLSCTAFEEVAT